jgi:drug/metabolite transporter (DMT)-like permease
VLPALQSARAATVPLSLPVIAAFGGIALLGEPLTLRFAVASVAILGGIALVVLDTASAVRAQGEARERR